MWTRPPPPPEEPTIERVGPRPPWPRRRRRGVPGLRARGQGLIDLKQWPAEPSAPGEPSVQRFGAALVQLCGWMPPRRRRRYARWIVTHGRQFGVDPFVVAALIYRQSLCLPHEESTYGIGLARINEVMHRGHIKARKYRFWILDQGRWKARHLAMPRYLFYPRNLRRSEASIYFAAALLAMWKQQCPYADAAFGSVRHRHYVSHFIWGDRVRDAGQEDRILLARRRLLQYYRGDKLTAKGRFGELAVTCPLDGAPRKITSVMGEERAGGRRRHKGVDFASTFGEPVRAVAAGRVVFAGMDARRGPAVQLTQEAASKVTPKDFGPGGLFVIVRHDGGVRSVYMHLADYTVRQRQQVRVGQLIGRVGRTGIADSGAHLHFELRFQGRHVDPMPPLVPYVFGPDETYIGRRLAVEAWRRRRRPRRTLTPLGRPALGTGRVTQAETATGH